LYQRLKQWFHNNTHQSLLASKDAVIPVKKPTKIPAPWQAYSTLYYQLKLKVLVDNAWSFYVANVKKENAEASLDVEDGKQVVEGETKKQKKTRSRIEIHNEIVQAEYKREMPEVKAKVEEYLNELKNNKVQTPGVGGGEMLLEKYQRLANPNCMRA